MPTPPRPVLILALLLIPLRGGSVIAQDESGGDAEAFVEDEVLEETAADGPREYPVESRGDQLILEGRYQEAADFFSAAAAGASGMRRDLLLLRQATAVHLAGYHYRAWELLKEVCQRRMGADGAFAAALYRAVDEMIINRRALARRRPYELPEEPEAPHPRDDFHFDSLTEVPDLRRTTRAGDVANLDIEGAPEEQFVELSEEELSELTLEELEEYEKRKAAWEREQRRIERLASYQNESLSGAEFDLYYATYYLALLREFDAAGAAELKGRIIDEVVETELETVAWYVNYSHVCADVDSAVADAEGSADYWSESHLLLTREVARMLAERFNIYLFSRQCGTGVGMHDIKRAIGGSVRHSEAHTVTVKSYGGDGIANPGYRAYAAINGSLIVSVGDVLRRLNHYPENWYIPQLRDFAGPEQNEAFLAGEAEGLATPEAVEGADGESGELDESGDAPGD